MFELAFSLALAKVRPTGGAASGHYIRHRTEEQEVENLDVAAE